MTTHEDTVYEEIPADAQSPGLHPDIGDGDRDPYALVDDVQLPLLVTRGGGPDVGGTLSGQALSVTGAEVSAIVREAGVLQVRLFNPSPEPTTARIAGRHGWLVDLRGRPVRPFEETIDLAPWQIVTASLT